MITQRFATTGIARIALLLCRPHLVISFVLHFLSNAANIPAHPIIKTELEFLSRSLCYGTPRLNMSVRAKKHKTKVYRNKPPSFLCRLPATAERKMGHK